MSPSLPSRLLRLFGFIAAVSALGACNQDSYASSSAERETHMGDIRAAAPPPASSAPPPAPAAPPPASATTH